MCGDIFTRKVTKIVHDASHGTKYDGKQTIEEGQKSCQFSFGNYCFIDLVKGN